MLQVAITRVLFETQVYTIFFTFFLRSLRCVDNIENRKTTVQRDLAVKDIRGPDFISSWDRDEAAIMSQSTLHRDPRPSQ